MWWPSLVLAALGLVDAAYLTWIKLTWGAGAYLVILVLLGLELSNPAAGEATRMAVFGFALVGTLYSVYLTYVELAILKAICPYFVASAVILTLLLVLSIIRLRQPWVEES